MKKHLPLAVIILLVFVSLCSAQNGNKSKAGADTASLEAMLIRQEKELWEAWKNKNAAPFEKALPADAVMVDASGVGTKGQVVKEISNNPCEIRGYSLSNFKVTMINKDAAILTFKATQDFTCDGKAGPTPIYGSSIYVKRGGQWLNIFHQETPAKQD